MESNGQTKVESELKEKPPVVWWPPELRREEGLSEVEASSAWSWESLLLTVKEFPMTLSSFKEKKKVDSIWPHNQIQRDTHLICEGGKSEWNIGITHL